MKYFRKKMLTITIVLSFFVLNTLVPKLSADTLFGNIMGEKLVYSFVWVPLMEISVLISKFIVPDPVISSPQEPQKNNSKKQPVTPAEYLLNLPCREPIIIKRIMFKGMIYQCIIYSNVRNIVNLINESKQIFHENFIFLPLILLFIKLLPRSDTSDLLSN